MAKEYKLIFTIKDYSKVEISEEFLLQEQFYLNYVPKVRCRNNNHVCTTTTKILMNSGEKIEYSTHISEDEYNELRGCAVSKILTKERHSITFGNELGLYDIYFGEIALKIVTLEFATFEEMQEFVKPDFLDYFTELSEEEISK